MIENIKQKMQLIERLDLIDDLEIYKMYKEIQEFGEIQTDVEQDDLIGDDGFITGFLTDANFLNHNQIDLLEGIKTDCQQSYYAE